MSNKDNSTGPRALNLDGVSVKPQTVKPQPVSSSVPKPLDLSAPSVVPASKNSARQTPRIEVVQGNALQFGGVVGVAATIEKIAQCINNDHPSKFQPQKIQTRLNRLLPIDLEKVTDWGKSTLETNLLNEVVSLSTSFSKLNGAELIDGALKAAQKPPSVLTKIIKSSGPLSFKPALTVLQQSLQTLKQQCDQYYSECEKYALDVTMDLVCLSATCEIVGDNNDVRMEKAMHDRKLLLTNACQQAQLVLLKVKQMIDLIDQQHTQVDQLLVVTLPAYQLANA